MPDQYSISINPDKSTYGQPGDRLTVHACFSNCVSQLWNLTSAQTRTIQTWTFQSPLSIVSPKQSNRRGVQWLPNPLAVQKALLSCTATCSPNPYSQQLGAMKIEWASDFNPDGSRRKPNPSTMHGWYAKWRGTFSGNENLRNKGMKEMRDAAKFKREQAKKKREARKAEGRSIFSFFFNRNKSSHSSSRSNGHRSRSTNTLARPSTSRQLTGNSRREKLTRPRTSHASRSSPSSPRYSSKSSHSRSHRTSQSNHHSRRSTKR